MTEQTEKSDELTKLLLKSKSMEIKASLYKAYLCGVNGNWESLSLLLDHIFGCLKEIEKLKKIMEG